MPHDATIRQRLGWPFDVPTLRRIKRLWVRHSIAEDAPDIDGLTATLAPDCVYPLPLGSGGPAVRRRADPLRSW